MWKGALISKLWNKLYNHYPPHHQCHWRVGLRCLGIWVTLAPIHMLNSSLCPPIHNLIYLNVTLCSPIHNNISKYIQPCFTQHYISTFYTVPSYATQSFTGWSRRVQICIYSVPFHAQQYISIFYTANCTVSPDLKISLALYSEPLPTLLLYRKHICI